MHVCSELQSREYVVVGKKSVFLKNLLLNSKLDILDNFANDGTVFPTASKKINQKAHGKTRQRGGPYVPPVKKLWAYLVIYT